MLYRDFMQNFRPVYAAPDAATGATDGAAPAAADGTIAAAAAPTAGAQDAAPAAAAPAASDAAPAADAAKTDSAPTLLEAASGKKPTETKPADGAEAAKPDAGAKKDDPAPADAAKPADAKSEADKPKDDAKKDEATKTDPDKKDATADAPPAPISYEAFKLPDGIKLDDKKLKEFSDIVGGAQLKQEDAQKLVDLYTAEIPRLVTEMRAEQRKHWHTLNDTWKSDTRKDPEIGGNRLETSLSMAKASIEEYGGTPEQQRELLDHLKNNGMGNFVGFIRYANNMARALNIFEDGINTANAQAPKAQKAPGQRGWYDKSLNAPS